MSIPSEHAHQMPVGIQQILQNEARLTAVVNPLAGSYYVEALTDEIRRRAWALRESRDHRETLHEFERACHGTQNILHHP